MSNLFDLSPDEFLFTLDEFGYEPARRQELIEGYNTAFAAGLYASPRLADRGPRACWFRPSFRRRFLGCHSLVSCASPL